MKARPYNCECDFRFTCRVCLDKAGPTRGDLPVFTVMALGLPRKIRAQSLRVAESIARHRTRGGKFDSAFL